MTRERLIERMKNLQNLIPNTMKAIEELPEFDFPCHLSNVLDPGELQIDIEYNLQNYVILRRALGKNYKWQGRWFHGQIGCHFIEFKHKSLDIRLDIKLQLQEEFIEGQSCRLVVDNYTKPEPIYKMECRE